MVLTVNTVTQVLNITKTELENNIIMNTIRANNAKKSYSGHRTRIRKRFMHSKLDGMHDYEALEFLLTFALPRIDTKSLSKKLLHTFGSISNVFDASEEALQSVPGIGPKAALLISLIKEISIIYLQDQTHRKDIIRNPQDVADYCRMKFSGLKHEVVHVLFISTKNEIIGEKTLFQGSIDQSPVYPRRIVKEALDHHASGFVLVHNHPSGDIAPSLDDIKLTKRIDEAARLLELRLLDHLIVGKKGYYSFKESGYFRGQ
ncbi:MAG: DNA repair protein RadC [Chlamydiota bacterium]|nr:DNA repair protein RadC [Chlamydiota bacterium]